MRTPVLFITGRWLWVAVLALLLVGGAGCGRRMCPVEGKVVYRDGSPFTKGKVVFEPLEAEVKVSALGEVHKDGTFRLGTYGEADGVPEGRYRVLVVPPMPAGEHVGPWPIHTKYI